MPDLSVVIPARNEMWLGRTVADVLSHIEADTEIIVVLDGAWPEEPIPVHERVSVIWHAEAIGQRAATNLGIRVSTAPYVMKLDAHCAVAQGFDRHLLVDAAALGPEVTIIPAQYNLHVFDWVCPACGHRTYQGPTPPTCAKCAQAQPQREVVWRRRDSRLTTAWRFDSTLHFQYWGEYSHRPVARQDIHDVMSCLGACWFIRRDRFWALGGLDEAHTGWGQMGTELACKSWLSGGRMVVDKHTWFAHLFRTQGGDFSFPYELKGRDVEQARRHSRHLWKEGRWPGMIRPLSWLLEHFWPVPGWTEEEKVAQIQNDALRATSAAIRTPRLTKGVAFYADGRLPEALAAPVRAQLLSATAAEAMPIVAVTLGTPPVVADPRWQALSHPGARGVLTMFEQILQALEALDTDIVFLCEHDVLYHPEHFQFTPTRMDRYYYNQHVWKVDTATGRALHYRCNQTSGLVAFRQRLLAHYRARVARVRAEGFTRRMGFEPGTHRPPRGIDDYGHEVWMTEAPNVDLRHGGNLTQSRWRQDQFRDQRFCQGWTEAEAVPHWGHTGGRFWAWLAESVKLG